MTPKKKKKDSKKPRKARGRASRQEDGEGRERSAAAEWGRSFLIAAVLFLLIRTFVLQTFVITSGSMEDTLLVGDFLIVNRVALGSGVPFTDLRIPGYSEPRRGDVLVFDPPHEERLKLVKRLVGMPGDTLEMRDGQLFIDGVPQEEPYVKHTDEPDGPHPWMEWQREHLVEGVDPASYRPTRDDWGPLVVPPGHYFTLGDNRERSLDSRYWGLLERWRLEGRAALIYFSYDKTALEPFPIFTEIRWGRIGEGIE